MSSIVGAEKLVTVTDTAIGLKDIAEFASFFADNQDAMSAIGSVLLNVQDGILNIKTMGGTPTTTDGQQLYETGTYRLTGYLTLLRLRMVRSGGTNAVVHITLGG
jgi:hypothetical protein